MKLKWNKKKYFFNNCYVFYSTKKINDTLKLTKQKQMTLLLKKMDYKKQLLSEIPSDFNNNYFKI